MKKDYVFYMKSTNLTKKQAAKLMAEAYSISKGIASKNRVIIGIEQKGEKTCFQ